MRNVTGRLLTIKPSSSPPLDNMALWLRADKDIFQQSDGTVPAVLENDVVGYCGDQSGNNNHYIETTTSKKPILQLGVNGIGGKPALFGDGVDDILSRVTPSSLAGITTRTLFIVYKGGSGSSVAIAFGISPDWRWGKFLSGTVWADNAGVKINWNSNIFTSGRISSLHQTTNNISGINYRINGTLIAPSAGSGAIDVTAGNSGIWKVDGSNHFTGTIAEIIVYSSSDSAVDNIVGNYLATRYSLAWSDI